MNKQLDQLLQAIKGLYLVVAELHNAFPERPFTPDGRMVGDIGEAIAAIKFGVVIDKKIKQHWDGYREIGGKRRDVQIKTTQKYDTYLKKPPHDGDLLVFKISSKGLWNCCYNGSIMSQWNKFRKMRKPDKTGAIMIPLKKLCSKGSCDKCFS